MSPLNPKDEARGLGRALKDAGPYLGIGSSLAGTLLVFIWGGHWLDKRFGTEPRYFLVGAGLGMLAAFYHFYKMYKALSSPRDKR
jgi:ATP synthase protein I